MMELLVFVTMQGGKIKYACLGKCKESMLNCLNEKILLSFFYQNKTKSDL